MAAYCDVDAVTAKLPETLPDELDDERIGELIADASDEIDDAVGPGYSRQYVSSTQKFPDYDDTPATPGTIKQVCLWLTLSACYEELQESNRGSEGSNDESNKSYYRNKAEGKLTLIRNGELDLSVARTNVIAASDKYLDDESDLNSTFTNGEMDSLI